MSDNRRRSRTQSLPISEATEFNLSGDTDENFSIEEINEEIEDLAQSRRPSSIAKEEISQARRFSEKLSAPSSPSESSSEQPAAANSSTHSLMGSIYSLGGAVWSFIRGPVETDSNDEALATRDLRRNKSKSKSFSFSSPKMATRPASDDDSDNFDSDSSDAPDFNRSQTIQFGDQEDHQQQQNLAKQQSKLLMAEPGRGKIIFERIEPFCRLIGREFPKEEYVLSSSDISTIQSQIPARWNVYNDWILLYSTRGNGFSLTTLYHQLKPFKGPVIIAVKDEYGAVFGAFLNQSLYPRQGHYGNGECFLWNTKGSSFCKYPSTGKNNYFIMTESNYLAVGCGGGKFGLWLEKELFKGISDPVPTFDNEQLATKQQFECIAIEIWGLDLNE